MPPNASTKTRNPATSPTPNRIPLTTFSPVVRLSCRHLYGSRGTVGAGCNKRRKNRSIGVEDNTQSEWWARRALELYLVPKGVNLRSGYYEPLFRFRDKSGVTLRKMEKGRFFSDANESSSIPQPEPHDSEIHPCRVVGVHVDIASYPRADPETLCFGASLCDAKKCPADSPLLEVWRIHGVVDPFEMASHDSILQEMPNCRCRY